MNTAADEDHEDGKQTVPGSHVASMRLQGQHHTTGGSVGLRQGQPIRLSFTADTVEIQPLLQALNTSDVPVSGVLAARGTVGGTMGQPTAMVTAEGMNLIAYDEPIGALNADVQLDGPQRAQSGNRRSWQP